MNEFNEKVNKLLKDNNVGVGLRFVVKKLWPLFMKWHNSEIEKVKNEYQNEINDIRITERRYRLLQGEAQRLRSMANLSTYSVNRSSSEALTISDVQRAREGYIGNSVLYPWGLQMTWEDEDNEEV